MDEDLDDATAAAAPLPGPGEDPVAGLIGSVDSEPAGVDDVVYGR